MKKLTALLCAACIMISGNGGFMKTTRAGAAYFPEPDKSMTAFPGAQGGGMYAKGARGAKTMSVYHVTNLNDSGEGSFRDAVSKSGRIVVFDISGMIDLKSNVTIGDNITVLGQTAPGDGICIRGNNVKLGGRDIIVRYIRFRVGSKLADMSDTKTQDGLEITDEASNVIMDHCSISWGTDENLSAIAVKDVTVQYSIISEALNQSIHAKGEHSYAGIWGGVNLTFHHNLIATHKSRNPKVGTSETVSMTPGYTDKQTVVDFRNNVFYNWGDKCGYGAENGANVNIVNNYYIPGPATPAGKRARIFELSPGNKYEPNWSGKIYADGNIVDDDTADADAAAKRDAVNRNNWQIALGTGVYLSNPNLTYEKADTPNETYLAQYPVNTESAREAYDEVMENAGARLPKVDAVDARVLENVKTRTAPDGSKGSVGLIDDPADGSAGQEGFDERGYPIWERQERPAGYDTDGDGIADEWELKMGLDPKNPHDSLMKAAGGYTWLEVFAESGISLSQNRIQMEVPNSYVPPSGSVRLAVSGTDSPAEIFADGEYIATAQPPQTTVYKASYENDGTLRQVVIGENTPIEGENIKIFRWNENLTPAGDETEHCIYAVLPEGKHSITARSLQSDGTYALSPVAYVYVKDAFAPQSAEKDFSVVCSTQETGKGTAGAYTGISVSDGKDTFIAAAGLNEAYADTLCCGKQGALTYQKNTYEYLKISYEAGKLSIYGGKTLLDWVLLEEFAAQAQSFTADRYEFVPEGAMHAAAMDIRMITEKTQPRVTIAQIGENDTIAMSQTIRLQIAPDKSPVRLVRVYLDDTVIAEQETEIEEAGDVEISLSFNSAVRGLLRVVCADDNLCTGEDSRHVTVSGDVSPWQVTDIGYSGQERTYTYGTPDYTYKLYAPSKGGIGGTGDECGYIYQKFTGDARIYYRSRMQDAKEFGIMLRTGLEPKDAMLAFEGVKNGGGYSYVLRERTNTGASTVDRYTLDDAASTKYFIVEKAGDKLNVYETENTNTSVYTTRRLLYTADASMLGDTYYLGFAGVCNGANPPDAGWVGMDHCSGENQYLWTFDNGLDWTWQKQEANVLSPAFDNGRMVFHTDSSYYGDRYVFHEFITGDDYLHRFGAKLMLSGDTPYINLYLQTGEQGKAYKLVFSDDASIYAGDAVIGAWEKGVNYTIEMEEYNDPKTYETVCRVTVKDGEQTTASAEGVQAQALREQINTAKKTPVTKAVYFEPKSGYDATYYIDDVSVNGWENENAAVKKERMLTFDAITGSSTTQETDANGFTMTAGMAATAKSKTVDGIAFKSRIQMDKGNTSQNCISFEAAEGEKIYVYAEQGGTSGERYLYISEGSKVEKVLIKELAGNEYIAKNNGKIAIYSDSKIYIYGVRTERFVKNEK